MKIFISHASEQTEAAERIAEGLKAADHMVFQSTLLAGEGIASTIKRQIDNCDLFIFLISPHSVGERRYPRSELEYARSEARRILPVLVESTPRESLPPHVREIKYLESRGDLVFDTLAAVGNIARAAEIGLSPRLAAGFSLLVVLGTAFYERLFFDQLIWFTLSTVASLVLAGVLLSWLISRRFHLKPPHGRSRLAVLAQPAVVLLIVVGLSATACSVVRIPAGDVLEALRLQQSIVGSFSGFRIGVIGKVKRYTKEDYIAADSELRYQLVAVRPDGSEEIYKRYQPTGDKLMFIDGIDAGTYRAQLIFYGLVLDESEEFVVGKRQIHIVQLATLGHDVPVKFLVKDTSGQAVSGVWVQVEGPDGRAFRGASDYSDTNRKGLTTKPLWVASFSTKEPRGYIARVFRGAEEIGQAEFRIAGATAFYERRTVEIVVASGASKKGEEDEND
ncbi:MAG: toll/interleukin-1 receptor domain-containing protein [bacterium]|nr:toll/interleukin-1 receptor domain-containing protein [bacterium]